MKLTNTSKFAIQIQRAKLDLRKGLEVVSSLVLSAPGAASPSKLSPAADTDACDAGLIVLPQEEYTIVARVVGTTEINGAIPLGRVLVWTRKVDVYPSRGLFSEKRALPPTAVGSQEAVAVHGPVVFPVTVPGVTVCDFALGVITSHPTTAVVGTPFSMTITISNQSAVPSSRLRISLHGSIDRQFVPYGRLVSAIPRVDSFGTATLTISLVPLLAGNWLLPLVEVVTTDKEVVASSKEVRSIAVHAAEVALDPTGCSRANV